MNMRFHTQQSSVSRTVNVNIEMRANGHLPTSDESIFSSISIYTVGVLVRRSVSHKERCKQINRISTR
jgi:hypothetical protein